MSQFNSAKVPGSIDQVIQSSQLPPKSSKRSPSAHDGATSFHRTAPLTPPTPPNASLKIPRGEAMAARKRGSVDNFRQEHSSNRDQDWESRGSSMRSSRESEDTNDSYIKGDFTHTNTLTSPGTNRMDRNNTFTNFFSAEIFQIVLRNPTTAHRLLRFCQSRACGENMEFLQKVPIIPDRHLALTAEHIRMNANVFNQLERYNRLLDEMSSLLGTIHSTYTSADAHRQINLSHSQTKKVASDIRHAFQFTLPGLESIFIGAERQVENLLQSDIYPRFVKHRKYNSTHSCNTFRPFQFLLSISHKSRDFLKREIADPPVIHRSHGFRHCGTCRAQK